MVIERILTILVGATLLGSCQSFNRIEISHSIVNGRPNASDGTFNPFSTASGFVSNDAVCPLYVAPELDPVPDLPEAELEKLGPNATAEDYDKYAQTQVKDLRLYINKMRKRMQDAQLQYLHDCEAFIEKAQSNQKTLTR